MKFLCDNWPWLLVAVVAAVTAAMGTYVLWQEKTPEERTQVLTGLRAKLFPKVNNWLLAATEAAESFIGSGNGKKKLALVYGWFCQWFPWISKIMPLSLFGKLVDDALDKLRAELEKRAQEGVQADNGAKTEG